MDICRRYVSHLSKLPAGRLECELEEVRRHVKALRNISEILREDTVWMATAAQAVDAAHRRRK